MPTYLMVYQIQGTDLSLWKNILQVITFSDANRRSQDPKAPVRYIPKKPSFQASQCHGGAAKTNLWNPCQVLPAAHNASSSHARSRGSSEKMAPCRTPPPQLPPSLRENCPLQRCIRCEVRGDGGGDGGGVRVLGVGGWMGWGGQRLQRSSGGKARAVKMFADVSWERG